jgi:hypothetical protein
MEVIFGRDFKLEAADPYLFYAYAFRQFSLRTRLIVSIGYGFGDSHINKMLSQALRNNTTRRLLVVTGCNNEDEKQRMQNKVARELDVEKEQITVRRGTAREFLETSNLAEELRSLIPKAPDDPF